MSATDTSYGIRIPIAFASDDRGVLMLGIALYSLLISQESGTHYVIYILDDGISATNREKILALVAQYTCEIYFIPIGELIRSGERKLFSEWPLTMYGRMFLPSLLPMEKRVLYLDIDILVLKDLRELFEQDPGDSLASVVFEQITKDQQNRKKMLGMQADALYFNSGVMLMELDRMRAEGVQMQWLDILDQYEGVLRFPDQDILNISLQKRVKGLHPKWNWPAKHTRRTMLPQGSNWGEMGKAAALEAALQPAILHFWGNPKPTQYNCIFQRNLYRRIWLQSPWREVAYSGKNRWKYILKRMKNAPKDIFARMRLYILKRIRNH